MPGSAKLFSLPSRSRRSNERGAALPEYIVLFAFIFCVAAAATPRLGLSARDTFYASALNDSEEGGPPSPPPWQFGGGGVPSNPLGTGGGSGGNFLPPSGALAFW